MSGTPNKRLHEESGSHSSLTRFTHPQDDSGTYSGVAGANAKLPTPSAPSDYHAVSYDIGQEAHVPKVPRTELDSTRSPLVKMYRAVPSSLRDSPIYDHAAKSPSDRVVESRDSARDNIIRDPKVESRDVKAESKDLYQGGKSDKDVRYVSRVDDQKDTKNERDVYSDYRNDVKTDKDHHRALKYPDTNTSSGNIDSWHASRSNVHGQTEVVRDRLNTEEKAFSTEAYEAVSENKVDLKRKDTKHRELGENNKERTEGRNIEMKDPIKEERKDVLVKDKDKVEDMDVSSSTRVMDSGKQKSMERTEKDADNKGFDKDSDDGGADVEGSADRDREAFGYGVQQRKRMLRPRGSPQVANRDSRFRSRSQDNDGKSDLSTVVYRVGECMQELLNMWKEYKSSNVSDKTPENSKSFPSLEIRIPAEHVTATNRQVKGGQLWGTDVYTHDSDLVAVLMHTGYCRPTASPPPPAIQELKATVRILPPQDCYVSALRNNVRSRAWGAAIGCGCSFRVERCHIVKKAGGTIDLEPCLTHTSTVEPTLAPVVVERTMTTRAAASNALRQQRFVREVTLQYNLCNEPWIKYSISAIADKGLKKPLFTSARLKKGEVLYLESPTRRYELCFNGEKLVKAGNEMDTNGTESDNNNTNNNNYNNMMDVFRWSLCKKPLPQTVMRSIGIPLPSEHLQVLEENLDWEDIQWSQTGVWISGKEYLLSRVHFLSPV